MEKENKHWMRFSVSVQAKKKIDQYQALSTLKGRKITKEQAASEIFEAAANKLTLEGA
jgi:hypothetical protein